MPYMYESVCACVTKKRLCCSRVPAPKPHRGAQDRLESDCFAAPLPAGPPIGWPLPLTIPAVCGRRPFCVVASALPPPSFELAEGAATEEKAAVRG